MRDGIAIAAFTDRGEKLAERLALMLGGEYARIGQGTGRCINSGAETQSGRCGGKGVAAWAEEKLRSCRALIFIGAAGIAVRAIAPFIRSKAEDPAVLCVDECGDYVIPLLSGHLGGANALACSIAEAIHATAVITTATDLAGVFAADLWAKAQGMSVLQPGRIRAVSAKILRGDTIRIRCPFPVAGEAPRQVCLCQEGPADVVVSYREEEPYESDAAMEESIDPLKLVPSCLVLGVGCRRGVSAERLEEAFRAFCRERGILPQAVSAAATISLKKNEEGLLAFCREHGWQLRFYEAEELRRENGSFTASRFVEETTGVDNVCERAAARCAGGRIVEKKYAGEGITFALAEEETAFDWRS